MTYLGIDIGQKGGLVEVTYLEGSIASSTPVVKTNKMPLNDENRLDIDALYLYLKDFVEKLDAPIVIFEGITTLHAASKGSNFKLALQAGAIEAFCIAMGLLYIKVPPKKWQEEICHFVPPIRTHFGNSDTKARAYIAVKQLFPEEKYLKSHNGIIDARLLAEWGRRFHTQTLKNNSNV